MEEAGRQRVAASADVIENEVQTAGEGVESIDASVRVLLAAELGQGEDQLAVGSKTSVCLGLTESVEAATVLTENIGLLPENVGLITVGPAMGSPSVPETMGSPSVRETLVTEVNQPPESVGLGLLTETAVTEIENRSTAVTCGEVSEIGPSQTLLTSAQPIELSDIDNKIKITSDLSAGEPLLDVKDPSSLSSEIGDVETANFFDTSSGDACEPMDEPSKVGETVDGDDRLAGNAVTDASESPEHNFDKPMQEITAIWDEFKGDCFTKGCIWSPDGTCLLTNSDDNVLRVYDLPADLHCQSSWPQDKQLPAPRPVLQMPEGGGVYDYAWYPLMSSWNPLSCCLVSTAQDNPTHLWDAFTGELRATYRAYNQVDEVCAAQCVAFDPRGEKLYCGFKDCVRVFDTAVPGRSCETRRLKDANIAECQRGIISCITVNPAMQNIYAVGSYLKSVGLYSEPRGAALCLMCGHGGGVTHLLFSGDGTKLFSGGRKDPEIICWDIRNPGVVLFTMQRQVSTNQRVTFDLTPDGGRLLSGGTDGYVTAWDLAAPPVSVAHCHDPVLPARRKHPAHADCANGVSIHQQYPIVATCSGQRHFAEVTPDGSDSDGDSPLLKRKYIRRENCVKLWWTGPVG